MLRQNPSAKALFRSAFTLYVALFLAQIVFCLFVVFLITQPDKTLMEGSDYPVLGLLVVFLASGAAWYMNKLRTDQVTHMKANHEGKLLHYRTTVLLRSAMVEAGNMFCIVLALLEGSLMPLIFFCLGLGVFLYFRPKLDEVVRVYQMDEATRHQLEQQLKNRM